MNGEYKIRTLCKVIKLHHSIYYYHKNNPINSYEIANEKLDKEILEVYEDSKKRYGAPKITKALNTKGVSVSIKRVQRRMRVLGIKSIIIKKYQPSSSSPKDDKEYPNLLNQDFKADRPGVKLVGDITYIYTKENKWTYVAAVIDLYDLSVIGHSHGLKMDDDLVIDAFIKADKNRKLEDGCIFHSDRGSQYTSKDFEELLRSLNIRHSYSKKGYPYDNAPMESFNATLKKEEVNLKSYLDFNEARLAIFEFIESWYNRLRIHSSIGYMTPLEKYESYLLNNAQSQNPEFSV